MSPKTRMLFQNLREMLDNPGRKAGVKRPSAAGSSNAYLGGQPWPTDPRLFRWWAVEGYNYDQLCLCILWYYVRQLRGLSKEDKAVARGLLGPWWPRFTEFKARWRQRLYSDGPYPYDGANTFLMSLLDRYGTPTNTEHHAHELCLGDQGWLTLRAHEQ